MIPTITIEINGLEELTELLEMISRRFSGHTWNLFSRCVRTQTDNPLLSVR